MPRISFLFGLHRIKGAASALLFATALLGAGLTSCGGGSSTGAKSPETNVVERAEGFSERPGWADPNVPFSRRDGTVRVLGYVSIDAKKRREAGFRASDSYARAELVRFLSTRIVAVLTDKVSTNETTQIAEAISENAQLLIDDISITAHYWEKVKADGGEKLHLYSRIDIDKESVKELLGGVWSRDGNLRTPLEDVQLAVVEGWDRLEDVDNAESSADLLPAGVYTPDWAKKGDKEDDQAFHFVCHGLASDEENASALAKRMCTEKLCRLFGVQIKSQTTVREDLEGIDVQSEVTEGCLDVRLEGRTTEYNGGECGPRGCVKWVMQKYPKSSYLAERKRLENPTIVERHVVVQEGGIKYKDPAACEAELLKYGAVEGRTYDKIKERREILQKALAACQGIDGREIGLYNRLTHLLETPLPGFTNSSLGYQQVAEDFFLYTSAKWHEEFKTARFFDQKVSMVLRLVKDAEPPLLAYHTMKTQPQDLKAIQKAVKPLYAYAYEDVPVAPTHSANVHRVHHYRPKEHKDPEFVAFLLKEARARRYRCEWSSWIAGSILLGQLNAHGRGTEAEWQAGLHVLKNAKSDPSTCASYLLGGQPSYEKTLSRARELLRLVESNVLVFPHFRKNDGSQVYSLQTVLDVSTLTPADQLALAVEFEGRMKGTEEHRLALAGDILKNFEPKYNERGPVECSQYLAAAERLTAKIPSFGLAKYDEATLCGCLKEGYSGSARDRVVTGLSTTARRSCDHVKDEEWPGGIGAEAKPPVPPKNALDPPARQRDKVIPAGTPANPWDVGQGLAPSIKQCLMNTEVQTPYDGRLNAYVQITARASSTGVTQVVPTVKIKSTPKRLNLKERIGWVTLSDVQRTERAVEACITQATQAFRPSADSPLRNAGPSKIWLLYHSDHLSEAFLLP